MQQSEINAAFFEVLDAAALPQIIYPNRPLQNLEDEHIRVYPLPSGSDIYTLGCDVWIGMMQISVFNRDGVGQTDLPDQLINLFPRGSKLTNGGSAIEITGSGWVSPSYTDGGWHITPTTIPYRGIK